MDKYSNSRNKKSSHHMESENDTTSSDSDLEYIKHKKNI